MNDFMGREGFTWFVGVVESTSDPLETGRVRVRALSYREQDRAAYSRLAMGFCNDTSDFSGRIWHRAYTFSVRRQLGSGFL